MALYPSSSGASRHAAAQPVGITEFEILKASHKFLRDDDERPSTWDEKLAGKYYASLYREFAVCDLKHYKSGNFSLRWRTEEEVLSGAGETTCGNTRCAHHFAAGVGLTTLELPFAYAEHGEAKSALVKVVLCRRCVKKLMWKRERGKEREGSAQPRAEDAQEGEGDIVVKIESETAEDELALLEPKKRSREEGERERASRRRRNSRSNSPHPSESRYSKRRRSPPKAS